MPAVIFDLDGVLVDSEPLHREVVRQVFAGLAFTREMDQEFLGRTMTYMLDTLIARHDLPGARADYESAYDEGLLRAFSRPLSPTDGATGLLDALRARGCRVGLASSSKRLWINAALRSLGLEGAFEAIASGDEVSHGKPAPDVYLLAADRLGVAPSRCVAVEDSPSGIAAARAAGMTAIGVITPYVDPAHLAAADHLIQSLREFPLRLLEGGT